MEIRAADGGKLNQVANASHFLGCDMKRVARVSISTIDRWRRRV